MRITVKKLTGESFCVDVGEQDTVECLKERIAREVELSLSQVNLVYNGKPLEDGNISDFGITNGFAVHLIIKQKETIKISVQIEGVNIDLNVESTETIQNVKQLISDKRKIAVDCQQLFYRGQEIKSGRLNHHCIATGDTLTMSFCSMQIFVRKFDGKTITLNVTANETVSSVKQKIQQKTSVPAAQQRLVFGGRQLDAGRLLDYQIRNNSTLELQGRLRGGN